MRDPAAPIIPDQLARNFTARGCKSDRDAGFVVVGNPVLQVILGETNGWITVEVG